MTATSATSYPPANRAADGVLVEIVADGGEQAGFGHLGRCLAIAEALGPAVVFDVRDELAAAFVRSRGARLSEGDRSAAPVVLLDRVAPTGEDQVRVRQQRGQRVALLDDMGSGREVADLVIDPPTAAAWPPAAGMRLHGFEHVLLRQEVRDAMRAADGSVLLAMGGSDPYQLTAPLAAALAGLLSPLVVARGPGFHGPPAAYGSVLASPGDFVPALGRAALLVASFGHTLLEAAHLGVPAIAVVANPEHRDHAAAFCSNGTAVLADLADNGDPQDAARLAAALLADPSRCAAMAATGRRLVDGRGPQRVATTLRNLA